MDFRGRVYPCPPHLNHLGSDMARSLLCFAKGEPLGSNGLNWLKVSSKNPKFYNFTDKVTILFQIHCINLTGLKKRNSVKERLEYAEKILPDIIDSAKNPLKVCNNIKKIIFLDSE